MPRFLIGKNGRRIRCEMQPASDTINAPSGRCVPQAGELGASARLESSGLSPQKGITKRNTGQGRAWCGGVA